MRLGQPTGRLLPARQAAPSIGEPVPGDLLTGPDGPVEDPPGRAVDPETDRTSSGRRHPARWVVPTVLLGAVGLTLLFYFLSVRVGFADSDTATAVLEGNDMAAGHVTLHGWALSVDSFWTVDALFYSVATLLVGVKAMLLHLVPAVIAMLTVVIGIVIARDGRRGAPAAAATVTVVCLLALPGHYLAFFFLRGPFHVATTLWCLVAFYAFRKGRFGWGWAVGVAFLAAGLLGDLQMVGLGLFPVVCAGLATALRTRSLRFGAPLVAGAAAAGVLAVAVRVVAVRIGAFAIGGVQQSAAPRQVVTNLEHVPSMFVRMLGIGSGSGGVPPVLEWVHIVGVIVVVGALAWHTVRLVTAMVRGSIATPPGAPTVRPQETGATDTPWRLDDLLFFGCAGGIGAFALLAPTSDFNFDRYLTGSIVFGSVLAARMVALWIAAHPRPEVVRGAAVLGAVCVLAFASSVGIAMHVGSGGVESAQPVSTLGRFLESHNLTSGIGDYWSSSVTTVTTDGAVVVRPVTVRPDNTIVRYERQSDSAWYAGQQFQFLVYNTAIPAGVNTTSATTTFGPPSTVYAVGPYRVLEWGRPLTVSAEGYDPVK